jgi:RNA polymerase sigma-70 factor, ECF subfamily
MDRRPLDGAARAAGGRIVAALAARFRDLDIADEAYAEACARAAAAWEGSAVPHDPAAWLYRAAQRAAIDLVRKRAVRLRHAPEPPEPKPDPETIMDDALIPDERLRLIFVCCHPAVAADARAALTLRLVCGLSTRDIARAFLLPEPSLAQRLVRAKRKIADAGVPFEVPGPAAWPERLEAVLSTLEVAYAKAHEDAAGAGPHAGYAEEMLGLTRLLAELLPGEPEVLAFAALVRFAEARRPARRDADGAMVPLSEQDPARWRRDLIREGEAYLDRLGGDARSARVIQAELHQLWCARPDRDAPPPWAAVLARYDALLASRDDPVVRINRAVALAEVAGPEAALAELESLPDRGLADFLPFQALRADLLRRLDRPCAAASAYRAALALEPGTAERLWLERRLASL